MSNFINIKTYNFRFIFFYCFFLTFLFVGIFYSFDLIIKVTPSDPLEYVHPAIYPQEGFPYLDRISLWYFIRFISLFGISNEYLGGVATLTQASILLFIILFWLSKRFDILTASVFFFIFLSNEYWLWLATYTYPTQLLTLITIGSVLLVDFAKSEKIKYIILGCATVLAIFSKVQGFAFFLFVLFMILINQNKIIHLKYYLAGLFTFLLFFICIIYFIDGYQMFFKLYQQYFTNENFSVQFKGRALSNFPNFLKLLKDPLIFIGFIYTLFVFFSKKLSKLKALAILSYSQILFLLFIYYITKRGGSVIVNYFLESITISLIFLAVLSSQFIKKFFFIFNNNNYFLMVIFIFFLGTFIFLVNFFYFNEISILFKNYRENKTIVKSIVYVILTIFLILFILKFKKQFYILTLIIFLIIFFRSSHYSIERAKFFLNWAEPYYVISNLAKSNLETEKRNLIFNSILNRSDILDAEVRIRQVAFKILELNQNEFYMHWCKGFSCNHNLPNTSIITDDLRYIDSLKKENFVASVLINKIENMTLSKTLYLLKN
jgi:hypothetical protein